MTKIDEVNTREELPPKVILLYETIAHYIMEDIDVIELTLAEITQRAGIGKGTVYEYFETKEEMILCALVFLTSERFEKMNIKIKEVKGFENQIILLLQEIEEQTETRNYLLKYLNLVFSSSQLGQQLKEKISEKSKDRKPILLVYELLALGIQKGEIREDLPLQYMTYVIISKIVGYMIYLGHPLEAATSLEEFRKLILIGIMEEMKKR